LENKKGDSVLMKDVKDLIVEVRNTSLQRIGQILPQDLQDFSFSIRNNGVGSWKITLPAEHPLVDALKTPGAGIVVSSKTAVLFSGPTTFAKNVADFVNPKGFWEIEGTTDNIVLTEKLAFPTPSQSDVSLQSVSYDTRVGKAEKIMKEYVNVNIGPSAPTARRIANLTVEAGDTLGPTLTYSARFDNLDKLIYAIATVSKLSYNIVQEDEDLVFKVFQPTNRSAAVRLDIDNGQLEKTEYTYRLPEVTRVIVGGAGALTQREFIQRTSTESLAAETLWGRKIEVFKDQRSAQSEDELFNAGDEELEERGKTIETVVVVPSENQNMIFGRDWFLGDTVSVVIGNQEITQVVKEVAVTVNSSGLTLKATVGEVTKEDFEEQLIFLQGKADDRLDNLERNDEAGVTSSRESVSFTTVSLTPGQSTITTLNIAPGYRLLNVDTTFPCRVRLYANDTKQTDDAIRAPLAYPPEDHSVILDVITSPSRLSFDLNPVVDGFTSDGEAIVPLTVTNLSEFTTPIQVSFIYVVTE
jgi:hypothetical protein